MRIALDTNAYAALKRGDVGVAELVRGATQIHLSVVVAGELLHGFRSGARLEENLRELMAFLDHPLVELAPVDLETADRFARVASALRAAGRPIPTNDIWIAAQALQVGARLVTFDRHFDAVAGLVVVRPRGP